MCSSISLYLRGTEIMRILPVSDSFINSDWITNLTRYFFDCLMVQRLDRPRLLLKQQNLNLS
jgi:NADH dehydrogenase/NADH:ubiquinone oxidoreductase subunit G